MINLSANKRMYEMVLYCNTRYVIQEG